MADLTMENNRWKGTTCSNQSLSLWNKKTGYQVKESNESSSKKGIESIQTNLNSSTV